MTRGIFNALSGVRLLAQKGAPGRICGRLAAATLIAVLAACEKPNSKVETVRPRVDGDSLVFSQDSPQLAGLSTDLVRPGATHVLRLTGRLGWDEDHTVRMFPAFSGRVAQILVKPGDAVQKGQALAELASPDYGQAQAEARRAQSDIALAEKNLARLRELYAHGVAARKELQNAETEYERASSEAQRALAKVKLYGSDAAAVDQRLALRSPIAGVVVERHINPGQELRSDLQLSNVPAMFVITDPSRLWVLLDATEKDLSHLRPGGAVVLRSGAYPEATFPARIQAISDFVDPATRSIRVRGSLANPGRRLKGEMFVTAELQSDVRTPAQVSAKAVFLVGDKHHVFVEKAPGRFTRVNVKTEGESNGMVGIAAGISPGQRVVVEGSLILDRMLRRLNAEQS